MPKNNRGRRNNNSDWGVMEMARERPMTAAAVAAGTAAAGLFLWSKRTQISDQLNHLSDQISEWKSGGQFEEFDDTGGLTTSASTGSRPTGTRGRSTGRRGMSETGGGNASLGKVTGGSGTTGSASGRGRARSTPTT